jgi:hypothetical protein
MGHRARGRLALTALLGAVVASCSFVVSLDGLSGGPSRAGSDASGDALPLVDGSLEASADAALAGSTVLAHVSGSTVATGLAQQQHLVYAAHAARWWYFAVDDSSPTAITSRSSTDFVTWVAGPSLALPSAHHGDGRAFSVAYADRGGRDVLHFTISLRPATNDFRHYHARAAADGAALTFEGPDLLDAISATDDTLVPDAPATAVAGGGVVFDTSGYSVWSDAGVGNQYGWRSQLPDDGTPMWTATWSPRDSIEQVPVVVNARALVPLAAEDMVALWEKGDVEPLPTDIRFSRFAGSKWLPTGSVFGRPDPTDKNDWSVWRVSDTELHAIRRTVANKFDHRVYDGARWTNGPTVPGDSATAGSGLVLLGHNGALTLLQVGADTANSVRATTLAGGSWSPWVTLVSTPAPRANLTRAASTGPVAILWTESTPTGMDVVALLLP